MKEVERLASRLKLVRRLCGRVRLRGNKAAEKTFTELLTARFRRRSQACTHLAACGGTPEHALGTGAACTAECAWGKDKSRCSPQ